MSSARSATSVNSVTSPGCTSRKPPEAKKISSSPPSKTNFTGPGFKLVKRGACLGVMAISPAPPSALNNSTGPEKALLLD